MEKAYEGRDPFIFVSYAHKDVEVVFPIIEELQRAGYRVWYDVGIKTGYEWKEYIAAHVEMCCCMLAILTRASVRSKHCKREMDYADRLDKKMLFVHLEDVELTSGMRMYYDPIQHMYRSRFTSHKSFIANLLETEILKPCFYEDAVERRQARRPEVEELVGEAKSLLASHSTDVGRLQLALQGLRALRDDERDTEAEQLIWRLTERIDLLGYMGGGTDKSEALEVSGSQELTQKAERGEAEDAVQAAVSMLNRSEADEIGLQTALDRLKVLPVESRDSDVERLIGRLEARVTQLQAERRERERREEEARRAEEERKAEEARKAADERENRYREAVRKIAEERESRERVVANKIVEGRERHERQVVSRAAAKRKTTGTGPITKVSSSDSGKRRFALGLSGGWLGARMIVIAVAIVAVLVAVAFFAHGMFGKKLSSYSWSELKAIANEIAAAESDEVGLEIAKAYGLVGSDGKLRGDTKSVEFADGTKAAVRIAGFRHDDRADGRGKSGITFEFGDIPAEHSMNPSDDNAGGWAASEMREYLNGDFLNVLPEELRSNILSVKKRTNNVGYVEEGTDAADVVTTEPDEIWLLSMSEVYGNLSQQLGNVPTCSAVYDAEGTQYQLYADQGVSTSNRESFCSKADANSIWWLRSPSADRSARFHGVYPDGSWGFAFAGVENGVSPGFCF